MRRSGLLAVVIMCGVVSPALAHFVWLEYDSHGPARAYFGEWAEDVREQTGGALDRIKSPQAFGATAAEAWPIARRADHLEIAVKSGSDVRLRENGLAPRENPREGGKVRTVYYARAGRLETQAQLELELVPTTANGAIFVLMFRGAPLPRASVTVMGPPKWEKPLRTDDQGRLTVPTPWAGRYVLTVAHVENQAGNFHGEAFDRLRHVATLSFVHSEGLPWPAQP
ncbi:MAG: DUF4198 domain-containing protein [Candidatus Tectimicrobiota bacterium]